MLGRRVQGCQEEASSPQPATGPQETSKPTFQPPATQEWVWDELQFLLEPPPTTLLYHLVLEAARELPTEDQRRLIVALKEEEAPQDPAQDTPEKSQNRQLQTSGIQTGKGGGGEFLHIPLEVRVELTLWVEDRYG